MFSTISPDGKVCYAFGEGGGEKKTGELLILSWEKMLAHKFSKVFVFQQYFAMEVNRSLFANQSICDVCLGILISNHFESRLNIIDCNKAEEMPNGLSKTMSFSSKIV